MIKSIISILKSYWEQDVVPFFRIMWSPSNKSTQETPDGLKNDNTMESYIVKSKDDAVGLEDDEMVQLSEIPRLRSRQEHLEKTLRN